MDKLHSALVNATFYLESVRFTSPSHYAAWQRGRRTLGDPLPDERADREQNEPHDTHDELVELRKRIVDMTAENIRLRAKRPADTHERETGPPVSGECDGCTELQMELAEWRGTVEAWDAGLRPDDDPAMCALRTLLDRFYVVLGGVGATMREMPTDELERREQTARLSWKVNWPNVEAVLSARRVLDEWDTTSAAPLEVPRVFSSPDRRAWIEQRLREGNIGYGEGVLFVIEKMLDELAPPDTYPHDERDEDGRRVRDMVPVEDVRTIDPAAIEHQRQSDPIWSDFHPERFCHRCGRRNVRSWHVASELWNDAVAGSERGVVDILCPVCFTEAHFAATGLRIIWELRADPQSGDLKRLAESATDRDHFLSHEFGEGMDCKRCGCARNSQRSYERCRPASSARADTGPHVSRDIPVSKNALEDRFDHDGSLKLMDQPCGNCGKTLRECLLLAGTPMDETPPDCCDDCTHDDNPQESAT